MKIERMGALPQLSPRKRLPEGQKEEPCQHCQHGHPANGEPVLVELGSHVPFCLSPWPEGVCCGGDFCYLIILYLFN